VQEQVISASGHWLMEEQPGATIAAVRAFLDLNSAPKKSSVPRWP
jgi:pimeloyl-ACP methyl ester carboxylesterase